MRESGETLVAGGEWVADERPSPTIRRWPRRLLAMCIAVVAAVVVSADWVERHGAAHFEAGRDIVGTLDRFAAALSDGDQQALLGLYSPGYAGVRLGLLTRELAGEKDGARLYRQRAGTTPADRAGALAEWRAYLESFASIEELGAHIHELEQWGGDSLVAVVRVEVLGTPRQAVQAGLDRVYVRMAFERSQGALQIRSAELVEGERVIGDRPQFEDVAKAAGVDFVNRYYPGFLSQPLRFGMIRYGPAGITAVDYDRDGFYDLFVPDGVESRLFRNRGDGRFEDVTAQVGLAGLDGVSVGLFADYDNDGRKDLFVSRTFQPNQLFHNDGQGGFRDVTSQSGIGADCCTTVASWGDYDNDGDLDLYVGRYLDPRTKIPTTFYARNGEGNQLYRNEGQGRFSNVTAEAGVGDTGLCLGSVWGDYDNDDYLDLYVVNDFGRKTLYHNNQDGTFTDVTVAAGTLDYGAGMSASMGDYDNDGDLDFYVANIRSEHRWFAAPATVWRYMKNSVSQGVWRTDMPLYFEMFRQSGFQFPHLFRKMASGNTLLRNRGDGRFEDVTEASGANPLGWFWGSGFADFDNDGWLDIYSANGWVYNDAGTEIELEFLDNVVSRQDLYKTGLFFDPAHFGRRSWHGHERNRYLRNNGDGTFLELGRAAGNDLLLNSRGIAVADFWNRGVLDIAVAASTDRHALLKNEVGTRRHWLALDLVGQRSNRDAVGARVLVRTGERRQMREVVLGDGYGSQNSLRQYFGLGEAATVDELTVYWPTTGVTQSFQDVAADRILELTEGCADPEERVYAARAQEGERHETRRVGGPAGGRGRARLSRASSRGL